VTGLTETAYAVELDRCEAKQAIQQDVREVFAQESVDTWPLMVRLESVVRDRESQTAQDYFDALVGGLRAEINPQKRKACLACLAMFRDDRGENVLRRALREDPDMEVRRFAVRCLDRFPTLSSVEALAEAFHRHKDGTPPERRVAHEALGSLGDVGTDEAAQSLRSLWRAEGLDDAYRRRALFSLAAIGHTNDVEFFIELHNGEDPALREAAVSGLASVATRQRENQVLLGRLRPVLRGLLKDPEPRIRRTVAYNFGFFGDAEDLPFLQPLLQDPYAVTVSFREEGVRKERTVYQIREAAQESIAKITARVRGTD
jgi:HEAT repeat protein